MSVWTHVNGSVRVDNIRGMLPEIDFPANLGKIVRWGDEDYGTIVPCGSEGSLEYTIWKNPDKSHMASYTITIFGDLRDYDDVREVVDWLNTSFSGMMIRSGIVEIDVEGRAKCIYQYDFDRREFVPVFK